MRAVLLLLFIALVSARVPVSVLHQDSVTAVPSEYIIVLQEHLSSTELAQHVQELERAFASSVGDNKLLHGIFEIGAFKGFSAKLAHDMLARELIHPNVSYVEANQVVTINEDSCKKQNTILWNLDRISETLLDLDGIYHYHHSAGEGVNAYIVDTGIYIDNEEFQGRASWGFAVDNQEVDGNGHGTHVAGTVGGHLYGVAKKVDLIAVKVLDTSGSGTTAGVISGVDYVTKAHKAGTRPSVANMSLGGSKSTALVSAVDSSIAAGVTYAVAAGNDNANACNYSPANSKEAVTVGATTSSDSRSSFSNYGACVDIFAPGSTITAAWIGGRTAVKTISGTSMASPHVAGAAAIILGRNPSFAPAQVKATLVDSCTTNQLVNVGTGSPNCLLFSSC